MVWWIGCRSVLNCLDLFESNCNVGVSVLEWRFVLSGFIDLKKRLFSICSKKWTANQKNEKHLLFWKYVLCALLGSSQGLLVKRNLLRRHKHARIPSAKCAIFYYGFWWRFYNYSGLQRHDRVLTRSGINWLCLFCVLDSSDVVETVISETETWLKLRDRDRDFAIKAETETWKLQTETETRDLTFLWW